MMIRRSIALALAIGTCFAVGACANQDVVILHPGGGTPGNIPSAIFYVNLGTATNSVGAYGTSLIAGGGQLTTLVGEPYSGGGGGGSGSPFGLTFARSGSLMYEVNAGGQSVTQFTVNGDNSLSLGTTAGTGGTSPAGVAVDPSGTLMAVANTGSNTVQMFTLGVGGAPTAAGSPVSATGMSQPLDVVFSADSKFLFVGNSLGTSGVTAFSVGGGGALSSVSGSPFSTGGSNVWGLALSPDGGTLYAANQGSATIAALTINSSGQLSPAAGASSTCAAPSGLAVTSSTLYVACVGNNSVDALDRTLSSLQRRSGAPYATGALKTDMLGLNSAKTLLVALNQDSASVSLFAINSDGTLGTAASMSYGLTGVSGANPAALALHP